MNLQKLEQIVNKKPTLEDKFSLSFAVGITEESNDGVIIKNVYKGSDGIIAIPTLMSIEEFLSYFEKISIGLRPVQAGALPSIAASSSVLLHQGYFIRDKPLFRKGDSIYWSIANRIANCQKHEKIKHEPYGDKWLTLFEDLAKVRVIPGTGRLESQFPNYFLLDVGVKTKKAFERKSKIAYEILKEKFELKGLHDWAEEIKSAAVNSRTLNIAHLPYLPEVKPYDEEDDTKDYPIFEKAEICEYTLPNFSSDFCQGTTGTFILNNVFPDIPRRVYVLGLQKKKWEWDDFEREYLVIADRENTEKAIKSYSDILNITMGQTQPIKLCDLVGYRRLPKHTRMIDGLY